MLLRLNFLSNVRIAVLNFNYEFDLFIMIEKTLHRSSVNFDIIKYTGDCKLESLNLPLFMR